MRQVMRDTTTRIAAKSRVWSPKKCRRLAQHLRRDRTAEGKKSGPFVPPFVVRRDHLLHPSDHHIVQQQRQGNAASLGGEKN